MSFLDRIFNFIFYVKGILALHLNPHIISYFFKMHIFASKQEETIPLGRSWSARTTRSTWTAWIHWFRFYRRATWYTRRKRYEGAFFSISSQNAVYFRAIKDLVVYQVFQVQCHQLVPKVQSLVRRVPQEWRERRFAYRRWTNSLVENNFV